jgi:hypothetical protein
MRARKVKPVEADRKEEIEHHLAAAHDDAASRRQHPSRDLFPCYPPRVPPPAVRSPLESRRLTRNDETQTLVDVGLKLVATPREDDDVRKLLRPLVELPVLFVAQRSRRQSVRGGDLVVVRDDGVAGDVEVP